MTADLIFSVGFLIVITLVILIVWSERRKNYHRHAPDNTNQKGHHVVRSNINSGQGKTERQWHIPSDPKEYTKAMMPSSAKKDTFK